MPLLLQMVLMLRDQMVLHQLLESTPRTVYRRLRYSLLQLHRRQPLLLPPLPVLCS